MKAYGLILVFKAEDLETTRLFYEALGFTLVRETHAGCPPHYSCDFGRALVEFYPASGKAAPARPADDALFIVDVERYDQVVAICRKMRLKTYAERIYDTDRRLRAMTVRDPDDRLVRIREIGNEAPH